MGFSLKGYVLEKPRVGSANSSFTSSPDNLVSDSVAYNAAYTTDESNPGRTEYLVTVLVDGDLANAEFGWTKNEQVQRFDYDGSESRFRPLKGSTRLEVGTVDANSNTTRLKVPKPSAPLALGPYRLAIGVAGSGLTVPLTVVPDDGSFGVPPSGTAELSQDTGNLNWNPTDITTIFLGQKAFFQRQAFFTAKETNGRVGTVGLGISLLNPLPATGQFPILRFGFGLPLTPIEKPDEASLSPNPVQGTVEWALDTGLLRFNSTDIAANNGEPIYYDGVLFAMGLTLPRQTLGFVSAPTNIVGLPSSGADLIFRADPSPLTGSASFPATNTLVDGGANFTGDGVKAGDIVVLTSGPNVGSRRAVTSVSSGTQLVVAPPFPSVAGANYKIERGIVQFPEFTLTDTFDTFGKSGQVQVNPSTGAVKFSFFDSLTYGARQAEVIFGDLPIERGISIRLFRTPVDLNAADPTLKDVAAFYPTTGATLADPIIGTPLVFLPVAPIDDPAYPMTFQVEQGTGSFTGVLPRLDGPSPPAGLGYTIDFDQKQFGFAVRRNLQVIPIFVKSGAVQLPDPLVSNALLELDQGAGYVTLQPGVDSLLESTAGVVTFIETLGTVVASGAGGTIAGFPFDTLTDPAGNFTGALPGDFLVITSGPVKGVYEIGTVPNALTVTFSPAASGAASNLAYEVRRGKEILADRFFQEVQLADPTTKVEKIRSLGTVSNAPRLNIPPAQASISRFRLGPSFMPTTTIVANDGAFTAPALLPQGEVEISQTTGNLNFSQVDVNTGFFLYWVRKLTQGKEYRIEPELGFIQVTERLLALDELFLTYSSLQDDPPTPFTERATFLVRKELTVHPAPTSTIPFNPNAREVATNPPPAVFRGGRPQDETQVLINTAASNITFLPDKLPTLGGATKVTDALPHGATVQPSERVYIDYFIYQAIGGENTTTVLRPSINLIKVQISEGATNFKVKGDRTLDFPANHLLRIEAEQAYYLAAPTYDAGLDETTVNLLAPAVFRDSFSQPKLYVSSGPVRITNALFQPSYFVLELAAFDTIPRGMNRFKLVGDKTAVYTAGVALYVSTGLPLTNDFYLVSGSTYDVSLDRTEVVLTQTTARQYNPGVHTLRRSVRPIFEASTSAVRTSSSPALPPPFTSILDSVLVFRQVEGSPGQILSSPVDFTIDDSGVVKFNSPLQPSEEFSIFYTRHRFVQPGQLRASYTASISPNSQNGLENQLLTGSFTALSPDTFYFRVETFTNFRAEIAKQYQDEAKSAAPSGGPRVSNASQPKLFEQGQESVFFDEGHLANEDIIARSTLKFYNDSINYLEDLLQNMDGRVVGDRDGRFKFDGTTGTQVSDFSLATNQIDDVFKISPFPIDFTPPLLPFKFLGTYIKAYQPNAKSRFYPTARSRFNYTVVGADTGAETGDQMVDLTAKNITGTSPAASRRFPRARVTEAAGAGATVLKVDTTAAITTTPGPFRPAFANGMKVVVRDPSGTYLVNELTPSTVTVGGPDTLILAPGVPVSVPQGSTVHLGILDDTYQKNYRVNFDVGLDAEKGFLLYIKPFFPFDGTVPLIPADLEVQDPDSKELLQLAFTMSNSLTAPEKIPALYGQTLDDDGDQRLPLLNPSYVRETAPATEPGSKPSYLKAEQDGSTAVLANTVAPFIASGVGDTGSLDGTATIITNSNPFPAPAPQPGDLVRILSGLNGVTQFRRVVAATANTVTVDVAFATPDAGFDYLITVASNLTSGTLLSMVGPVITDLLGNFIGAGVKPGHTVVLMQPAHPAQFERRQVLSVDSATQITLTAPFSNLTTPALYRVHNPISTYSDVTFSAVANQLAILSTNPTSELNSIDNFYNEVFTDRLSPIVASGNATAADTLVGLAVNFIASGVTAGDFVYVQPGSPNEGIYTISDVVNATTLKVSDTFGSFPVGVTFRVVKAFGVGANTLKGLFTIRQATDTYVLATTTWQSLITTPVDVLVPPGVVDPTYYARAYLPADFTNRASTVTGRKSYLDTAGIAAVEQVLSSGDRLYDRRFTWIDARINLEKGIIVKQERAVAQRIKAQQDILNQLIKLLAVEEG